MLRSTFRVFFNLVDALQANEFAATLHDYYFIFLKRHVLGVFSKLSKLLWLGFDHLRLGSGNPVYLRSQHCLSLLHGAGLHYLLKAVIHQSVQTILYQIFKP